MKTRSLVLVLLLASACTEPADIRPSALFTDGVVLQRGQEIRVWGTARAGAEVEVSLNGIEIKSVTGEDGNWMVTLPAMEAGGPYELEVEGSGYERYFHDVMIGDVWVASGQSNMEWPVSAAYDAEAEIAAADDPLIRQFHVPHMWSATPVDSVVGGPWTYATPEQVGDFSAVAYSFARELRQREDVAIGILHTSWGGSRIEPWMSMEALGYSSADMDSIEAIDRRRAEQVLESIRAQVGEIPMKDEGLVDGVALWAAPDLEESAWSTLAVPAMWETRGYPGVDGLVWYRTSFDLTAEEAAAGVSIGVGRIDDSDWTWVNGIQVGSMTGAYNQPRVYEVPASALHEGANVIAVRVEDTGGNGGIGGEPGELFVRAGGSDRPLAGDWKFRLGEVRVASGTAKNQVPVGLYHSMIDPFLPYAIKGAIWYQGESNAGDQDAYVYRDLFATMISDWRERWGVGDFPFLWVQLANYLAPVDQPGESGWAMLRESQSATLALSNTGQAVIIDIGEANDIHPRNKQDVGKRLALAARHVAYGEDLVYSGPTYGSHVISGREVRLEFDHVGGGLEARARPTDAPRAEGRATAGVLTGFAIAGRDRRFVWATARIEGSTVIVSSPQVSAPVAVRYGWGFNPETANLFNAEGLPASPFRTDTW